MHPGHKMPATLGQLSGTGGLGSDAFSGFGGFDPVTGIANVSPVLFPKVSTTHFLLSMTPWPLSIALLLTLLVQQH